jgi:hypothetical protein
MINCEWIRKQKKERPSLGSSPGPKCKPNVRLRVRCANTQQPCFSALCDAWLLRKRDEIRESSYIKYRAILERHIKPRLGSRRLGGICTASVDAFTRELLETDGLSVKTVHDILSVLHSVLKDTEARRPAGALAVQIRYPKGKRREMRVLTIEEQKRLVAYLLHPTDSCKFGLLLALYTGLRIGELCALCWSCIDLREQTIRIAATMQRLGGTGEGTRIVIGAPKSDSSLRTIPLPAQIALAVADAAGADFVRVEHLYTGAEVTSAGLLQGQCCEITALKRKLGTDIPVYADVWERHGIPLCPQPLDEAAWQCVHEAFADGLFLCGKNAQESLSMARQVRQRVPGIPLFLGGGATGDNVRELLQEYDAVCVATWIKNGDMRNPVDPDRTRYFMEQAALAEVGT